MIGVSTSVTSYVLALLTSEEGVNASVLKTAHAEGVEPCAHVRTFAIQNVAAELTERTLQGKYPAVLVYCDKVANTLREKFRALSGTARVCIEVRCSQDRLEGLDGKLQFYTDAVCQVLENSRGDWSDGLYYAGGYEVSYGTVRPGGNYFLQTAKVVFEIEVSR